MSTSFLFLLRRIGTTVLGTGGGVYISTCQYLNDVFKFDAGYNGFLGLTYFTSGGELEVSLIKKNATPAIKNHRSEKYFSENFKMIVERPYYEFEIPAVYRKILRGLFSPQRKLSVNVILLGLIMSLIMKKPTYEFKPMLQLKRILRSELDLDCLKLLMSLHKK